MLFIKTLQVLFAGLDADVPLATNNTTLFAEAQEALVGETIYPGARGRITCGGIFYRAEIYGKGSYTLHAGQRIWMVGLRENIALVVPSRLSH